MQVVKGLRPRLNNDCPVALVQTLEVCWSDDPHERLCLYTSLSRPSTTNEQQAVTQVVVVVGGTAFEEIEEELECIIDELKSQESGKVVHIRPKTAEELAQYG